MRGIAPSVVRRAAAKTTKPAGLPQARPRTPDDALLVQHLGSERAVVRGPATGNTYVFDGLGSRVNLDRRDQDLLRTMRSLRQLPNG